MSFKTNDCQQITFNDALWGLTDREKRMLEKSWAKPFAERIFPLIDESKFACLYSDKASRPNTPVNICVGALILKELFNMTDGEMVESLMFDVRFQYALHTTGYQYGQNNHSDSEFLKEHLESVEKRPEQVTLTLYTFG